MRRNSIYLCGTAFFALAMAPDMAFAQTAGADAARDEIVVTANKREQRLQDVGVAVSVLSQEVSSQIAKQDIAALARRLPAVQITPPGSETTIINIRGVAQNDLSPVHEAPIAFYNDGVYISNADTTGAFLFDIARIEVLRGPQGTLFGRNATGGLIQTFSQKPTDTFSGYASVTVGNFNSVVGEAALGGPITDRLRVRASFITRQGGGYVHNDQGRDAGSEKFYAGRLQLNGDVGDTGEFTLKVEHARNVHDTSVTVATLAPAAPAGILNQGQYIGPNELGNFFDGQGGFYQTCPGCDGFGIVTNAGGPFQGSWPERYLDLNKWITNVSLNYKQSFGDVEFASITGYLNSKKHYVSPVPYQNAPGFSRFDLWQATQELRLSESKGRFRWTAGVYGMSRKSYGTMDIRLAAINLPTIFVPFSQKTESLAAFGQVEYDLSDKFTAIGGLRLGKDWQHYSFLVNIDGQRFFEFTEGTYPDLARRSAGQWSGKFELDFKPSRDVLIYASVNRGTKIGGYNQALFLPPFDPKLFPIKGEVLTNYEAGAKLTFLDGRAHFNIAGFHYDYNDYQAFQQDGPSFHVSNYDAKISGAEFDLDVRPAKGLFLQAFGSYLDAKVLDVPIPSNPAFILDRQFPNAPKWTFGGSGKYEVDVGNGKLEFSANAKYQSAQYFDIFNGPVTREGGYTIVDARIGYTFNDPQIELSVFANNLTDTLYRIYANDDSLFTGNARSYYGRPRSYGVTLRYDW